MLARLLYRLPQWQLRLAMTAAFTVNMVLAYLLMLAVMTFNVGCFLAVVTGLTVGYFLFVSGKAEVLAGRADADLCCPQNVD